MMIPKQSRSAKREYWQKHNENWQASGLSQKKYCDKEKISLTTFTWWRSKGLRNKANPKPITFMPAVIKEATHSLPDNIQVILPNQVKVMLPANQCN